MTGVPLPIEQYALIGDTHSCALVGLDGSIDWLCLPRFDSAACFAALLGTEDHGRWLIAPVAESVQVTRAYRGRSLILDTEFSTSGGRVRVTDYMPQRDRRADICRRVEGLDGEVTMRFDFVLRFDYGRVVPWVRRTVDSDGHRVVLAIAGPDGVCLRGDFLPPRGTELRHQGEFTVSAGEVLDFSMTWYPSHHPVPRALDSDKRLQRTEQFWHEWAGRCRYDGPYADAVQRSLLTLKALTYAPTGGIVAAATTSLPEQLGGERNWDYRYCWLRDASLTLWSLLATGFTEEARAWRAWLLRAVAGDPRDLQILYGVAGERRLPEWTVDWLPGYENSTPVRVGNDAYTQVQADIYGEIADALAESREAGIAENEFSWPLQLKLMANLEQAWDAPDNGIWEIRGPRRDFTHSRMMVWVALDRAVRAVETHGLDGPVERWRALRDKVHAEVCERGYNEQLGAFTQYYGGTSLDATALLIPHVGFLPADDPRVVSTVAAIERQLKRGPFVLRYDSGETHEHGGTVDGLPPGEGAFLMCSFWLVRTYALAGRVDEATELFEQLLALRNDVGLLAEEYDTEAGRMVGNFPQAFSHLALVAAAYALASARRELQHTEAAKTGDDAPGR